MQGDRTLMIQRLSMVSYFRLSGYWYTFRRENPADFRSPLSDFKPGTTFDSIWDRYAFDRRLRLLVMDAVERIEVAVRSLLASCHATRHGLFAYAEVSSSLAYLPNGRTPFLNKLRDEQDRSKDAFVKHFRAKYGNVHTWLPVWMAVEVMSFGTLLTFFRGCHQDVRVQIAKPFGVHDTVFASWMLMIHTVRNICAHHGRRWNREIGTRPMIPDKIQDWHVPVKISADRVFGVLSICKWCLDRVAPQSEWPHRFRDLLRDSPNIPIASMGFPDRWELSPIWA